MPVDRSTKRIPILTWGLVRSKTVASPRNPLVSLPNTCCTGLTPLCCHRASRLVRSIGVNERVMTTILSHLPLTTNHNDRQRLWKKDADRAPVHFSKSLDHHLKKFSALRNMLACFGWLRSLSLSLAQWIINQLERFSFLSVSYFFVLTEPQDEYVVARRRRGFSVLDSKV